MSKEGRVFLYIVATATVLFLAWRYFGDGVRRFLGPLPTGVVNAQSQPAVQPTSAPWYTSYNQPWNFQPPVQNFSMPTRTQGQVGQVYNGPCNGC